MNDFVELNAHEYAGVYDPTHPISRACGNLVARAEALRSLFELQERVLAERKVVAHAQWMTARAAADADLPPPPDGLSPQRLPYHAPLAKRPEYVQALSRLSEVEAATHDMGGFLVVNLVAAFDTFLGELLRASFKVRPELLETSRRQITWSDVKDLETNDAVRGLIVEREVQALMHESRAEQIPMLDRRLGLKLPVTWAWKDLIELSERRNLYAHQGGRVSAKYLSVCDTNERQQLTLGGFLASGAEYFNRACDRVIVLAIELTQMAWRTLAGKNGLGAADRDLAQLTYVMLVREQWTLAERILMFATKLPKHSSEQHKLVFVINRAQALKWMGNEAAARQVMSAEDWTAKDHGLQLSAAVLADDFDSAGKLMLAAGTVDHVMRSAFDHWPIYREFRTTPQFAQTYQVLYGSLPPTPAANFRDMPTAELLDPP